MSTQNKTEVERMQLELADMAKFPEMNPGPVCRFDRSGKVLLANSKAKKVFGEKNLLGKNWMDICPGITNEIWKKILECKTTFIHEAEIENVFMLFTHLCSDSGEFVF